LEITAVFCQETYQASLPNHRCKNDFYVFFYYIYKNALLTFYFLNVFFQWEFF